VLVPGGPVQPGGPHQHGHERARLVQTDFRGLSAGKEGPDSMVALRKEKTQPHLFNCERFVYV